MKKPSSSQARRSSRPSAPEFRCIAAPSARSCRILRNFYREMAAQTPMRCLGFQRARTSPRRTAEWHRQSKRSRTRPRSSRTSRAGGDASRSSRAASTGGCTPPACSASGSRPRAASSLLLAATFFVRMFAITGGYHRYFAHKTYKTSRAFQLVLAVLGASAVQKGALWWAGHHRIHHKYSDQPGKDVHSPKDGFWYSHQGWIFDGRWDDTSLDQIPDFARFPELVWLNRWHVVPPIALALLCLAIGGFERPALGLRHLDRAALARDLLDQLARAPLGYASLRHPGHEPQQPAARPAHARRGLAQQPPPLLCVGAPGLLLVGDRRQLLRAARARGRGRDLGRARAARPRRAAPHRRRRSPPEPARAQTQARLRNQYKPAARIGLEPSWISSRRRAGCAAQRHAQAAARRSRRSRAGRAPPRG